MAPQRVRCSPLGTTDVVADVVERIPYADTAGHNDLLVVSAFGGHRYRVAAADCTPLDS